MTTPTTVIYPVAFAEARSAGNDGVFDWAYLLSVLPRGISPMDIDAEVQVPQPELVIRRPERLHWLIIESKNPGVPIPVGQQRNLYGKALTGFNTILIMWGKNFGAACRWQWWHRDVRRPSQVFYSSIRESSPEVIRDFVGFWARIGDSLCSSEHLYLALRAWDDLR